MNSWLMQVYTDHRRNFKKYLHKYKIKTKPECEICNKAEDIAKHPLYKCTGYEDIRPNKKDPQIGNPKFTKFIAQALKQKYTHQKFTKQISTTNKNNNPNSSLCINMFISSTSNYFLDSYCL